MQAYSAELMITRESRDCSAEFPLEAELVTRVRQGDEAAFTEIVTLFQNRLFNFVRSRVRNRELAEDITQEVFVKAYYNLSRLREPARFKCWLFSIAHNHLRDLARRRKIETVDTEESGIEHYVDNATPQLADERERTGLLLREALSRLKPEQREILVLCDIEGLAYKEISGVMGIPLGTVQSRIFYARRRLKEILTHELGFAGEDI
jgi:RNA polymerase sigma-70 factor (ECF subfamily)